MRIVPVVVTATLAACASAPPADKIESRPSDAPLVKPAARGLALVVYWFEGFDGAKQTFELAMAHELEQTYQQHPQIFRREGHYERFDPELFAKLAGSGSDDAVVVELSKPPAPSTKQYGGKIRVIGVNDEKEITSAEIAAKVGSWEMLAKKIRYKLARIWNDPAAGPPLDPISVADRLAEEGACDLAVKIYAKELPKRKAVYVVQAHELQRSWERDKVCRKKIETRERRLADRAAVFKLEREFFEISPRLKEVFEAAIHESRFPATLAKHTNKPATLMLGSGQLVLNMRYQKDVYRRKIGSKTEYKGQPAFFLEPYVPVMRAVLSLKDTAKDDVPRPERPGIEDIRTSLRLSLLSGDYLEIEFAGGSGRVILADTVHVHLEGQDDTDVPTSGTRRDLRAMVFPLGPTTTVEGNPTTYGVVTGFLSSDQ